MGPTAVALSSFSARPQTSEVLGDLGSLGAVTLGTAVLVGAVWLARRARK